MNQSGGNGSSLPLFEQPTFQDTAAPAPTSAPSRPKARRRRSRRAYHALKATEYTLQLPPFKPLGFLAQTNLIKKAQEGDIQAKQTIWLAHSRLAYSVINRYGSAGVDPSDAIQQTLVGLSRAIEKFDPQYLNEFSTYAYQWLRQSLFRYRCNTSLFMRIPVHHYGPYIGFRKKVAFATTSNQWFDARAAMLDADPKLYHTLLRIHLVNAWLTFNHAVQEPCPKDQPLQQLVRSELIQTIQDAVEKLPEQQAQIIRQRYGLYNQPEKTLEEIASQFHLTRERIRQIQVKAEVRLERFLRDYMQQNLKLAAETTPDTFLPLSALDLAKSMDNSTTNKHMNPPAIKRVHTVVRNADLDDCKPHGSKGQNTPIVVNNHSVAVAASASMKALGRARNRLNPSSSSGGSGPGQANDVPPRLLDMAIKNTVPHPVQVEHKVSFDQVFVGREYNRQQLAELWNYQGWHALDQGIVTPARDSKIILFMTKAKQITGNQFHDHFEGNTLYMEGEAKHTADNRLLHAAAKGDQIHLFYRERYRPGFTYYGEVHLKRAMIMKNAPTRFIFDIPSLSGSVETA